ncbi:MAG: hypothetical protein NC250_02165 [Alistipes senegalensis]|nr:hypothetical protein [Bacteroides cellulosilyticus]MCM1351522.1 hypothetical protein [Alistipes senegalensis]
MKKVSSIFVLLGLLLCVTTTVAQTPDGEKTRIIPMGDITQIGRRKAQPSVAADTLAAAPKKGFIRRIFDYFDSSNVDRTFEKKIDWSIAPGPNYSSDVGFGIGFLLAGLYRLDRTDSITAPSNISIYGNFTTQKFVLLRFSGDNIFNQNKQRLSYSGAFVYFPGAFYGIGYDAGKSGYVQSLTTTMGIARVSYCRAIVGQLYAGVSAGVDYTGAKYKDSGIAATLQGIRDGEIENPGGSVGELYELWQEGRYDPALQDPFTNFIAASGDNPDAFNTNIGLFLQYDSRDVTYNASHGVFVKAEAMWYPEFLGNTRRNFGRVALTFDAYRKLWKGAVLAYDLYADFIIGTPSWHLYSKLGGMSRMRGYYEGRYRDKRLVETQAELRQKIYRRHGLAGWFGLGQVWGTDKFRWDNTLYSFGVGYRFEFKKGMNIRLDYGWGVRGNKELPWDRKRSSAFLFTASEAF